MKKNKIVWMYVLIITVIVFSLTGCAGTSPAAESQDSSKTGFGAEGALSAGDFEIEGMLKYAIQDEYLARQEYEMIMDAYGQQRPFSNIIQAEETHIALLKEIYQTYGYEIPEDNAAAYAVLPDSIDEAIVLGVTAEENNIAMYNLFLEQELPDDIKAVFVELRDASENHLAAFEKGPRGNGNGRNDG